MDWRVKEMLSLNLNMMELFQLPETLTARAQVFPILLCIKFMSM